VTGTVEREATLNQTAPIAQEVRAADNMPAAEPVGGWQLFKTRDFCLLWWGQAISQVGDGLNKVALLWFVYTLTGSALKMTIIGLLQTIPPFVLGPILGVYLDRWPKKPVMVIARKSVANFKVREGAPSAFMVTLRGARAWHFLDRLMNLAIPRIKDFRGVKDSAFDAGGTYSMGLTEQAVWPEINTANMTFTHGMHINIVFENSNPKMSRFVLEELGMPFVRKEEAQAA
jgi:hypothetical protein